MKAIENERDDTWTERIQDYRDSGLTMKAWCADRGVTFHQLKYWLKKLSPGRRKPDAKIANGWMTLNPIPEPTPVDSPLVLRVGGATIDIRPGFDPTLLRHVIRALEADA